jgi:uncharacterized protein (DUF2062 family)
MSVPFVVDYKLNYMEKKERFLKRKLVTPLLGFLTKGVTPSKLALAVGIGLTVAVFPVLGATTLLCALAAFAFKLNMPAIQLVNYFAYPLQFLLFIPYIRMGEWLFSAPKMALSIPKIYDMFKADLLGAMATLWGTTMHAIVVWTITGPPVAFLLYLILTPVFKKLNSVVKES